MKEAYNQESKSKKTEFVNRFKSKYPDIDTSDEEAFYAKISDDYDKADETIGQYKKNEESLSALLTANPRAAAFLTDWRNGKDPVVAMVERFGEDFREALDDPDKMEKIKEAQKNYLDRITSEQKLDAEFDENLKKSIDDLEKYAQDNGLSEDEVGDMYEKLSVISRDYVCGKMLVDTWDMIRKAVSHDNDVAIAVKEAEVRAKNGKIKEAKLREAQDIPPSLSGHGVPAAEQSHQIEGVLGQQGSDIWNGMKRTSRK